MPGDVTRVRFAPSPTGYFHVGSARTALFNWLVARAAGGVFVLRIEDTDAERNREEWVEGILAALSWLSMDADEGPYRQSHRLGRYTEAVDALWEAGRLYACECTHDEIEARRKQAGVLTPGYDGFCRARGLPRGEGRALRFRTPDDGTVTVDDVVRGKVEFPCDAMDDFVAVKANGAPLFVLANVVDDIDMAISHVIRGEDLLPTTPRGILVWLALAELGWTADGTLGEAGERAPGLPLFAHLPMLVNEKRQKLSKRRDPVSVESYRDDGYLPDAFVNYLALLGWGPPGGQEICSVAQMIEWFRLEDVNHAPAFFDVAKLTHMNGEYIRAMGTDAFVSACGPWLEADRAPGRRTGSTRTPSLGSHRSSRSGWPSSARSPAWSTSCSSTSRRSIPTRGRGRSATTGSPARSSRGRSGRTRTSTAAGRGTRSARRRWRSPRTSAGSWGRPRHRSASRSPGAGWGHRSSSPSRCSVRVGRSLACGGPSTGWARADCPRRRPPGDPRRLHDRRDQARRARLTAVSLLAGLAGLRVLRLLVKSVLVLVSAVALYLAVTAVQVWLTGRRSDPGPAGAIVVMGAAQYNGVPSPDLAARLDEAELLWRRHYATTIMVTGAKEPGDRYTESEASARYLLAGGIPSDDILQAGGRDSWGNLADAAPELLRRGDGTVLVVTDPFHEDRSLAIASSVGLTPHPTPTRTSPISGLSTVPYYAKETVGVALGRIIGFENLSWVHSSLG